MPVVDRPKQREGRPDDSRTIRVHMSAYDWFEKERAPGESMPDAVDRLVRDFRRWKLALGTAAAVSRLRNDPAAWDDYRREIAELDGMVADGLASTPWDETR